MMNIHRQLFSIPKGFTLLEVMISLVIFSIGLIGLAGLQAIGLQNNRSAYNRTVATHIAYDLADRIRNNRNQDYTVGIPGTTPTSCIGTGATCTAAQLTLFDLFEWDASVKGTQNGLINAQGFISLVGATYTIKVEWGEGRVANTTEQCTATPPTGIECVTINMDT